MLAKRVIPCLDVAGGRVVKGTRFVDLRDAGDPVEVAARYEQEAADELFKGSRGQVIKGLNNLNARDGYTVIYDEETFTVKE